MEENNEHNPLETGSGNFDLPEGYFLNSAGAIFNRIECLEELRDYPRLGALNKEAGFIVPEGYFQQGEIRLELLDTPVLLHRQPSPFVVPEAYFEDAEALTFSRFADVESVFPTLDGLKKAPEFMVGEDYFERNAEELSRLLGSGADKKEKGRILSLRRLGYAAAALLVAVLGLWIYTIYNPDPVIDQDCGTMACLDKVDLVKTKNLEDLDTDELFELVNTGELEMELNKEEIKKEENKVPDSSMKDISTEDLLDEI